MKRHAPPVYAQRRLARTRRLLARRRLDRWHARPVAALVHAEIIAACDAVFAMLERGPNAAERAQAMAVLAVDPDAPQSDLFSRSD